MRIPYPSLKLLALDRKTRSLHVSTAGIQVRGGTGTEETLIEDDGTLVLGLLVFEERREYDSY